MAPRASRQLARTQAAVTRWSTAVRTKAWLKPVRKAGVLSLGRGAQGLLELAALAFAARALEPAALGLLVLLHSFVNAVGGLAKFKSTPTLIRYGAQALQREEPAAFQRLVKFTLRLDALGALVALVLVMLLFDAAVAWFTIPEAIHGVARFYLLTVVVVASNDSASAILRLLDRYALVSVHAAVGSAVRSAGAALLLAGGAGLEAFILLWMGAQVGSRLAGVLFAAAALHRGGLLVGMLRRHGDVWRPVAGIWRFVWGTQLASSVSVAQKHLALLMVGGMLDPAGGALFRIGRDIAESVVRPLKKLLLPALFPEIARQTARGDRKLRRKLVLRHAAIAGAVSSLVCLGLVVVGRPLVVALMGEAFAGAYAVMLPIALAGVAGAIAIPIQPLLYATGRVRIVVVTRACALLVFAATLYPSILLLGVVGAGVATLIHAVAVLGLFAWLGRAVLASELSRREAVPEVAP